MLHRLLVAALIASVTTAAPVLAPDDALKPRLDALAEKVTELEVANKDTAAHPDIVGKIKELVLEHPEVVAKVAVEHPEFMGKVTKLAVEHTDMGQAEFVGKVTKLAGEHKVKEQGIWGRLQQIFDFIERHELYRKKFRSCLTGASTPWNQWQLQNCPNGRPTEKRTDLQKCLDGWTLLVELGYLSNSEADFGALFQCYRAMDNWSNVGLPPGNERTGGRRCIDHSGNC